MTDEELFKLARQASFHTPVMEGELKRFAILVAAHERERICKQIALLHDTLAFQSLPPGVTTTDGLRITK